MKKLISLLLLLFFFQLVFTQDSTRQKIGIVLSGGGVRGLGHIGVLKALEEKNIKIDLIVGSSIGGLIGGMYSAGYELDEIEKLLLQVNWDEIYDDAPNRADLFLNRKNLKEKAIVEMRFSRSGAEIPRAFSSGQKLRSLLTKKVLQSPYGNNKDFDNFRIPLRIVATDFLTGERTVFRSGDLAEVIHGSISVPLLYEPVEIDSSLFVDGGLSDNLPIDVAKECGADYVIASDLSSPLRERENLKAPWEVADQVIGIMMSGRLEKKREMANLLIRPDLGNQTAGDWTQIPRTIEMSFNFALNAIDSVIQKVNFQKRTSHFFTFENIKIKKDLFSQFQVQILPPGMGALNEKTLNEIGSFIDSLQYNKNDNNDIDEMISAILIRNQYPYVRTHYSLHMDTIKIKLNRAKIRNIQISGNEITEPMVIKRELEFTAGDWLDFRKLSISYNNVHSTDLFQRVGMNLVSVQNTDFYDLTIKVKEKKSNLVQLGLRYDNTRFGKSFLEFSNQNIFGYGIQNNVFFEIGEMDRIIALDFNSERLGYSKLTAGAHFHRAFNIRRRYEGDEQIINYDDQRTNLGVYIGWQVERFGQIVLWGIVENLKSNYDAVYDSDSYLFSKLKLNSVADQRDSRIFPHSGINNEWSLNIGHYEISGGRSREFVKFYLQLSEWYQINSYNVIGALIQNGLSDSNLPYEEFFEWGGWDKMPGFMDREYACRTFWLFRLNYRLKVPLDFPGNYFFDFALAGGKSSLSSQDYLNFEEMVYGFLVGISVETFVGPLQLSYGYNDTNNERVYLNIGFPF